MKAFRSFFMDFSHFKSDFKVFRPDSRAFTSDCKDFRDFTPIHLFKIFFTGFRGLGKYRDFRPDFRHSLMFPRYQVEFQDICTQDFRNSLPLWSPNCQTLSNNPMAVCIGNAAGRWRQIQGLAFYSSIPYEYIHRILLGCRALNYQIDEKPPS